MISEEMSPTSFQHAGDLTPSQPSTTSQTSVTETQPVPASETLTKQLLPPIVPTINRSPIPVIRWAPTNYITPALGSFGNTAPVMSPYRCAALMPITYGQCQCCCDAASAAATSGTSLTQCDSTLPQAGIDVQSDEIKKETWSIGFYEVGDVIGQGNYARVRKGYHRIAKIPVAVKCIDKLKMDEASMIRAKREIEVLRKLNHPNIATLYQVFETARGFYLVMQYAANGELADFLPGNRIMPEAEARIKLWQIVSAIEYCHSLGIVHRDLKLENLLLDKNYNIKIVDFGFSNFYSSDDTLKTFCGSPPYAAPEIFEGREYTGPEVDIWSMGVILYKLVCGDLPFNAPAYHDLRYRVTRCPFRVPFYLSTDCENLLRKMLHKNPKRRATIATIKSHPWMLDSYAFNTLRTLRRPVPDYFSPNDGIVTFMEKSLNISRERVEEACRNNARDDVQAWYTLLWELIYLKDLVKEDCKTTEITEQQNDAGNHCEKHPTSDVGDADTHANVTETEKETEEDVETYTTTEIVEACELRKTVQERAECDDTKLERASNERTRIPPEKRPLTRQSTTATITSLDEGFETDAHGSSATIHNSKELPTKVALRAASLPHESVDAVDRAERNKKSCVQSCPQQNDTNRLNNSGAQLHQTPKPQEGGSLLTKFSEDTEDFRKIDETYETYWQINDPTSEKSNMGNITESTGETSQLSQRKVNERFQNMFIAQQQEAKNGKNRTEVVSIQKRVRLPEGLEFQPHKLLNIKQSLYVEQQISDLPKSNDFKQAQRFWILKQLQLKNRLNHGRQQIGQKHSCFTQLPPTLPEEPAGTSQSPTDEEERDDDIEMK